MVPDTKIKFPEKYASESKTRCYVPRRYILTFMGFLGMLSIYAMRVNLSVAMVAMVNNTNEYPGNSTPYITECAVLIHEEEIRESEGFKGEKYNWDSEVQGLILGSFFYGYVLTQIPGGILSEKFSAKWIYGFGTLVTAVFSLATPYAASLGTPVFIVVRIIEGLGEGVTFPAMNVLISSWAHKLERSRLSTIICTGGQIGNVIAMPISGWLSSSDVLGGWPSVFYVFGAVGCVWFLLWCYLIHDTPSDHPSISKEELLFLQQEKENTQKERLKTPWKAIFTSLPVWATIIAHFGNNFGFLILLTELPSYLSTILHFDLQANGMLSALPYILQAVSAWLASIIADKLRESKMLSITTIRKIFNSIGFFGPALCLLSVTVSGCNPNLIVALISLAMALNGCIYSGYNVTHVDMSPLFAGILFGITNAASNTCGFIAPAVVGFFTASGATRENWASVFYITAAVYTVTAAFYAIFASAELQPWGMGTKEEAKPEKQPCSSSQTES